MFSAQFVKFSTIFTLATIYVIALSGCNSYLNKWALNNGYKEIASYNKELATINETHSQEMAKLDSEHKKLTNSLIATQKSQMQKAGNSFYAIDYVYHTIDRVNRTDLVIYNYANEGWSAIGNAMPDYSTMVEINKRVKKELDEKQTTIEQLKKDSDKIIEENKRLVKESELLTDKIVAVDKAKTQKENDYKNKVIELDNAIKEKQNNIISLEKTRADNKQWVENQKRWAMGIIGGIALISTVISIYVPIMREKFVILASVLWAITIAIPFIQPIHVFIALGVVFAGVFVYLAIEHKWFSRSESIATETYRAIEQFKQQNPEEYSKLLKPILIDRHSQYDENGKLIENSHADNSTHIDKILAKVGDK